MKASVGQRHAATLQARRSGLVDDGLVASLGAVCGFALFGNRFAGSGAVGEKRRLIDHPCIKASEINKMHKINNSLPAPQSWQTQALANSR